MKREYEVGDVVKCRSRGQFYDAKILNVEPSRGPKKFRIHYIGWNNRHDEWVDSNEIRPKITPPRPFSKLASRDGSVGGDSPREGRTFEGQSPFPSTSSVSSPFSPSTSASPGSQASPRTSRIEWTMRRANGSSPFHSPASRVSMGPSTSGVFASPMKSVISPLSQELISQMASSRIGVKENGQSIENGNHHHSKSKNNEEDKEPSETNGTTMMKRKHEGHEEAQLKRKVVELVVGKNSNEKKKQSLTTREDEMTVITAQETQRKKQNGGMRDKLSPKISELEFPPPRASTSSKSPELGVAINEECRKETASTSSLEDTNVPRDIELGTELEDKPGSAIFEIRKNKARRMRREGALSPTEAMLSLVDHLILPPAEPTQTSNAVEFESIFQELRDAGKKYEGKEGETLLLSQADQHRIISEKTFNGFTPEKAKVHSAEPTKTSQTQEREPWYDPLPVGCDSEPGTPQPSTSSSASLPEATLITNFTPETALSINTAVMVDYNGTMGSMPDIMPAPYVETICEPMTSTGQDFGYLPMRLDEAPAGMLLEQLVVDPMDPMGSQTPVLMSGQPLDYRSHQPQGQTIQLTLPPGVHPSQVSLGPGMRLITSPRRQGYVLSEPQPAFSPQPQVQKVIRRYVPVPSPITTPQPRLSQDDHTYGLISPNGSEASAFSPVVNRPEGPVRPMPLKPMVSRTPVTPMIQEVVDDDDFYQAPPGQIIAKRTYMIAPRQGQRTNGYTTTATYQTQNGAYHPIQIVNSGAGTYYQTTQPMGQVQLVNGSHHLMTTQGGHHQLQSPQTPVAFDFQTNGFHHQPGLVPMMSNHHRAGAASIDPLHQQQTFKVPVMRTTMTTRSMPPRIRSVPPTLVNRND